MKRSQLLAIVLGMCLIAVPFASADAADAGDGYDDGDDAGEAVPETEVDEKHVVVLGKDNFDAVLKKHTHVLVEFYAPWCGHCKKLTPEYAAAAATLAEHSPDIVLAKVDATEETELGERFGIQGFPTIKWFVDGMDQEYTGGRDADAIVKWVKKKTGPPAVTVSDVAALKAQEEATEVLVVGFFATLPDKHPEKHAHFATFTEVAKALDDVAFVQTTSAAVAKAAGLENHGVAVITNFEGEERATAAHAGDVTDEALRTFIAGEKLPLTIPFNSANTDRIFGAGIPRHVLMVAPAADLKPDAAAAQTFREVATALKGHFVFVTVDADDEEGESVVKFFELEDAAKPAVVIFDMEPKQRKYRYTGSFDAAAVRAYVQGVLDGTVQPQFKSEEIPAEDLDGGVRVVVGKSFDAVVKDATKDVLLEVYAPWCGHCKELEPVYRKLAKRFQDIDSVVIAKMDGTLNEHADLDVSGFPTLLFYPAREGAEAVPFEGERLLKDLTKFIKENAAIPYELPKKAKGDAKEEDAKEDEDEDAKEDDDEARDEL